MKDRRIMVITNMIPPYRVPLFNQLQRIPGCQFKVIALSEREKNREWQLAKKGIKFDYQILPGWHNFIRSRDLPIHLNGGLWRALRQYKPDVIITTGYETIAAWEAFLYRKLFKKRFILLNGTTLLSTGKTTGFIGRMKRVIIKGADRYIAYGTKAAEYLVYMGAPSERIHVGVNTVDMSWFRARVKKHRTNAAFQQERDKYPKILLLYVGQLIRRKGLFQVLKAIKKLGDTDIGLMVVGSGPQGKELMQFCYDQGLRNIYFEGFHQQDALPKYYSLADVLILPSFKEVWGLVVNEALASGLFVLCSDRAGSAYDLIQEGWNGKIFDPHNVDRLAELIQETKEQIEEIHARREPISEHACQESGIERSAKAFLDAIRSIEDLR